MTISTRPLDLGDPAQADAWLTLLDHYACDPMGGGQPLSTYARTHLIERLAARTDFVAFLAHAEGRPAGLVNAFEGFSTFAARPLLNIHDIVVHRDLRGRGVGQALLAAVEDEGRRRGCCKLTLEVLGNNTVALASYRRFGFADYALDPAAGTARFLQKPI
ncbi:MAG: GNAT family N-acetyltransferase [Rhodocyclaceae bacterium]|nr:GNAT family N-acetyltransferase [Rhodocyclaceae bacterium]